MRAASHSFAEDVNYGLQVHCGLLEARQSVCCVVSARSMDGGGREMLGWHIWMLRLKVARYIVCPDGFILRIN